MQCDDCPNQTDGKCCHQSIRTQGSKTMNLLDEQAWQREFEHVESKQKQREECDGWQPTTEMTSALKHFNEMVEQVNEK